MPQAETITGRTEEWWPRIDQRLAVLIPCFNEETAIARVIAGFRAELPEATIYITVEPCLMCAGALYWSKIGRIVYGTDDEKNGYRKNMAKDLSPFHPKTILEKGVLKEECAELIKKFFKERR